MVELYIETSFKLFFGQPITESVASILSLFGEVQIETPTVMLLIPVDNNRMKWDPHTLNELLETMLLSNSEHLSEETKEVLSGCFGVVLWTPAPPIEV